MSEPQSWHSDADAARRLRRGSLFILIQADAASRRGLIQALALPVGFVEFALSCPAKFTRSGFGKAAWHQVLCAVLFAVVVS
jgi:hypothetical protein